MKASLTPAFVESAAPEREPFSPVDEAAGKGAGGPGDFLGLISRALNRPPAGTGAPGGITSSDYYHATAANPDANGVQNSNARLRSAKASAKKSNSDEERDSGGHRNKADAAKVKPSDDSAAMLTQSGVPAALPPPPAADDPAGVTTASTGVGDGSQSQTDGPPAVLIAGVLAGQSLHHGSLLAVPPTLAAVAKDAASDAAAELAASEKAAELAELASADDIKTQAIDIQKLMLQKASGSDPPPDDGTAAALNKEHMKFGAEKNEIAGGTEQKVPRLAEVDHGADGLAQNAGTGSGHDFSDSRKEPGALISAMEFSVQPGLMATSRNNPAGDVSLRSDSTAQVEQVTRLVSQEAMTVRQMGATSLAVSLKLDAHTELFLQLTNTDGQIQASLRCERGNIDGLSGHWGQLQESLARQNVQLLPLTEQGATRHFGSHQFSGGSESRQFDQPPQSQQRQAREVSGPVNEATTTKSALPRGGKNQKPGRQGWESWA